MIARVADTADENGESLLAIGLSGFVKEVAMLIRDYRMRIF